MKKLYLIFSVVCILLTYNTLKVKAQDFQFSQYYAAPLYLNPAFTGTGKMHRFHLNTRLQYPALGFSNAYRTVAFSYDYNLSRLSSGFGFLVARDVAGSGDLGNTNVGFLYSYRTQINKKLVIAAGTHFSYVASGLNKDGLTLGDQIASQRPETFDDVVNQRIQNISYFDFATGILVYSKMLWGGVALQHLTEPDVSLIGDSNPLEMKISIHGGIRIPLYRGPKEFDHISSIAPSFIYKRQGINDQLDIGVDWHYDPISAGLWYRGFPFKREGENNYYDTDAMIFHFGLEFPDFQVGYSYDFTISELGGISGGAHEISITYDLVGTFKKKRKEEFLPCPTF